MNVIVKEENGRSETEVMVLCREADDRIRRLEQYISQFSVTLMAERDGKQYRVRADGIFYLDTVDKRTFLYGKEAVYESREPLKNLEKELAHSSFLRISKNCLLNYRQLDHVEPLGYHHMLAYLRNGESVVVNRTYLNDLKECLKREL